MRSVYYSRIQENLLTLVFSAPMMGSVYYSSIQENLLNVVETTIYSALQCSNDGVSFIGGFFEWDKVENCLRVQLLMCGFFIWEEHPLEDVASNGTEGIACVCVCVSVCE